MEEVSNFCPAMAVPITVKMPAPITAPMPRAVSDTGPRVFFSRRSGSSESEISLSIDLQQKSWLSEVRMVAAGSVGDGDKRWFFSSERVSGMGARPMPFDHKPGLAFRLAASQFLDLALFRSAGVVAGLLRLLRLVFLASGAF